MAPGTRCTGGSSAKVATSALTRSWPRHAPPTVKNTALTWHPAARASFGACRCGQSGAGACVDRMVWTGACAEGRRKGQAHVRGLPLPPAFRERPGRRRQRDVCGGGVESSVCTRQCIRHGGAGAGDGALWRRLHQRGWVGAPVCDGRTVGRVDRSTG
eukprot:353315-Chlamydomonas_euryale.AAC.1